MDEEGVGSGPLNAMSSSGFRTFFTDSIADWRDLRLSELQFWRRADARLMIIGLIALLVVLVIARTAVTRRAGRHQIILPALPRSIRGSRLAFLVHTPLVLFLAGLVFFALALGDPYTSLVKKDVTYPGRRIALLIDASSSMRAPFLAQHLNARAATDYTFFTTVGAAKRFVELRLKSKYRDLMSLIEFGNEAYVVTPFTNDYDNILLSISLIGDPVEFSMFPDQGTIIAQAIDQSVGLFKAFNFLDASGNLMVIFTDGEDTHAVVEGKSLDDIVENATASKVPVYMVRTNYSMTKGKVIPDELWIPAIAKTGGKFFAASDENSLIQAINEIDRVSAGSIEVKQYTRQQPRFAMFTAVALIFWVLAAGLKLTLPYFQRLP
jgi:Ca-activated chloride channel homolog